MRRLRFRVLSGGFVVVACAFAVLFPPASRADWWVNAGGSGDWNDGANWNTGLAPVGVGEVIDNGTAIISSNPSNQPLNEIWCGNNGLGNNRIRMNAGSLAISDGGWFEIGRLWNSTAANTTTNVFNLNGGSVSGPFKSEIGWQNGSGGISHGILSISNNAVLSNDRWCHLGVNYNGGSGARGVVYVADNAQLLLGATEGGVNLGFSSGSQGIIYQSGGSLVRHRFSGGNGWWFNIGDVDGGYGEYNLLGGTMEMYTGDLYTHAGDGFNVGSAGTGVFNVSGGTAHLRDLIVGKWNTGVGTVNQTGGRVDVGLLVPAHGELRVGGFDGDSTGAQGTYNLSDGVLVIAPNLQVGAYGIGTFNQTGGAMTNNGWFVVGRFDGSVGIYNISSGNLRKTAGGGAAMIVGEGGNGTLNVSGDADVGVQGDLRMGVLATGAGTLSITGGTATVSVTGNVNLHENGSSTTGLELLADATGITPITAGGDVTLNNAALTVDMSARGPYGTVLLIDNQGGNAVVGTFQGLPEGAAVPGSGSRTITYAGGTGNDVVLEPTLFPPQGTAFLMK